MANHRLIEERAAAWLVKRNSGDWTANDEADLGNWLAQKTSHRVAFLRLEVQQSLAFDAASPDRKPRARAWYPAVAAVLVVAIGVGVAFWLMRPPVQADVYATQVGGLETVTLRDGSGVTLNTATRIQFELRAHERRIELRSGEAYFTVSKDPQRPFVVEVGDKRVVALGTQFAVRREGTEVRVVVTEGSVNLQGDRSERLEFGSVARTRGPDILIRKEREDDLQALVGWRDGRLTFRDTTLAEAVAELNRYNVRQIEIGDSQVGALRVSGTFRPTHYEAFVRLLREGYAIRVADRSDKIILTQN